MVLPYRDGKNYQGLFVVGGRKNTQRGRFARQHTAQGGIHIKYLESLRVS